MSLSATVIDAMLAAGCTAEQIAAVVKADLAADEARKAAKRANNAERQRRFKAKKVTADNADNALPALDNAADGKGGDGAPKEYIQTPSLPPKGSEATASGAEPSPPTAKQVLWSKGKALLVDRSGMSKAQAGDLIGKWVGQWGVEVVLAKVEAAEAEAENPKTWIAKALGREPKLVGEPNETALADWIGARQPRMRADQCLEWARRVLKPVAGLPAEAIEKGVRFAIAEDPKFDSEMPSRVAEKVREQARYLAKPSPAAKPPAPPPAAEAVTAEQMAALRQSIGKTAETMRAA